MDCWKNYLYVPKTTWIKTTHTKHPVSYHLSKGGPIVPFISDRTFTDSAQIPQRFLFSAAVVCVGEKCHCHKPVIFYSFASKWWWYFPIQPLFLGSNIYSWHHSVVSSQPPYSCLFGYPHPFVCFSFSCLFCFFLFLFHRLFLCMSVRFGFSPFIFLFSSLFQIYSRWHTVNQHSGALFPTMSWTRESVKLSMPLSPL